MFHLVAWSAFGIANVLASALLLTLGLLFLRARRSEFTLAFATYSVFAAGQKFAGGMWLYFDTPLVTDQAWQIASTLCLLASTPTLAHALSAFTWERRFALVRPARKALLYVPFALVAPLAFRPAAYVGLNLAVAGAFMALLGVFALAVARKARSARTAVVRSQSRYMIAYLVTALAFSVEIRIILFLYGVLPWWEISLAYMVATGILLYGILRTHLFDIDLKVKWTLRQSTIAAIFVAVFFITSELAATFLSDRMGTVFGIVAAGTLVFALSPLQRAAERLADRAMPDVRATPDYLQFRRFEIYRGAVEHALSDGSVTPDERALLDRLRRDLAIPPADAAALESDLLGRTPA